MIAPTPSPPPPSLLPELLGVDDGVMVNLSGMVIEVVDVLVIFLRGVPSLMSLTLLITVVAELKSIKISNDVLLPTGTIVMIS